MPNRKTDEMRDEVDRAEATPSADDAAKAPGTEDRVEARPEEASSGPAESAEAAPEAREPEDVLEAAQAEIARLKDQLLRALAETENVRRRAQREREDAAKFGVTAFARDLLPVADNLRRALDSIPREALQENELLRALAEGVEMTERELLAAFERHHIRKIEPLGERFDSNLHQAMFEVPGSGQPAGTVVQLLQPGYLLHDRLIRPAMVGVAKGEPAGNGQAEAQPGGDAEDGGGPPPPGGRVDTTA